MTQKNSEGLSLSNQDLPPEFSAIRVESVLTKLPLHTLSKTGSLQIQIEKRSTEGGITLLWEVSPSRKYGEPRILAYRLDTLLINKKVDEAGHPVPRVIRLGSLREISRELGLGGGGSSLAAIKEALAQNAGAVITAKLSYRDRSGKTRKMESVFTRYAVVYAGETLPDGAEADSVYIVFNDIYRQFLDQVPFRPLDFNYMRNQLRQPSVIRFYEIVSFRMYAALKYGWPRASMNYSDYCESTGQKRHLVGDAVFKQMYKVHKPHLDSGYLTRVEYERTADATGKPDWVIWYTPGVRAKAEYQHFNTSANSRQQEPVVPEEKSLPLPPTEAEQLALHFMAERFGNVRRRVSPKELLLANEFIQAHGLEAAKKLVSEAVKLADKDDFKPLWLTGLERYVQVITGRRAEQSSKAATAKTKAELAEALYQREATAEVIYSKLLPLELAQKEQKAIDILTDAGQEELLIDDLLRRTVLRAAVINDIVVELETNPELASQYK